MEVIRFHVEGLPPQKDGVNSMWGKRLEAGGLVNLRRAAKLELNGSPPLTSNCKVAEAVKIVIV